MRKNDEVLLRRTERAAFAGLWNYQDSVGVLTGTSISDYNEDAIYTDDLAEYADTLLVNLDVFQVNQLSLAGDEVELELYYWGMSEHTLTFSATGLPEALSIDSETGEITGTIEYDAGSEEAYTVVITTTDTTAGVSVYTTFTWQVEKPVVYVNFAGDVESIVGASIEITIDADSTTGATLTFSATGLPDGLTINEETGVISGTIDSYADAGSPYSVTVTVADDNDSEISAHVDFSWYVRRLVTRKPADQANLVGSTVAIDVIAPYAGVGTLVFSATGLPAGLAIDVDTGEITGTIDGNADATDPYSVTVTVTDGTLTEYKTFSWTVKKIILEEPGAYFNLNGDEIEIEVTVSAITGHTVTYSAVGLPSGVTINASTGEITGTLAANAHESGPYTVTVTATDTTASVSSSKTLTWNVLGFEETVAFVPSPPRPTLDAQERFLLQAELRDLDREIATFERRFLDRQYEANLLSAQMASDIVAANGNQHSIAAILLAQSSIVANAIDSASFAEFDLNFRLRRRQTILRLLDLDHLP